MKNNRRLFLKQAAGFLFVFHAVKPTIFMNTQGIITRTSPYTVKETIDRLVVYLEKNGATIYGRINQQNEVRHTGKEIRPLEFLLFGTPAKGAAIMEANPLAALDLPLKIVAWETADQTVNIAWNDPLFIKDRYSLPVQLVPLLNLSPLIEKALS